MTIVPPIKSQGIKTKLVPWIRKAQSSLFYDRWVEPFMGTGSVIFNIQPRHALLCDTNPHLINFYNAIKYGDITSEIVREFLTQEGKKLLQSNGEYYYEVRERFNNSFELLDFLFLSRSCFNGMMRFNRKGGFNVPFCKKPNRFAQALITKITNQVKHVSQIISCGNYEFQCQDYRETILSVQPGDIIYCDPPYTGRHVDYFDSWSEEDEFTLCEHLGNVDSHFILSTWLKNRYRVNNHVFTTWKDCFITTREHFYHVGGSEKNRNAITEALLTNFKTLNAQTVSDFSFITDGRSGTDSRREQILLAF